MNERDKKKEWEILAAHSKVFGYREDSSDKEHWDYTLGGFRAGINYERNRIKSESVKGFDAWFKGLNEYEKESDDFFFGLKAWLACASQKQAEIDELKKENEELRKSLKFTIECTGDTIDEDDYDQILEIQSKYFKHDNNPKEDV